MPTTVVQSGPSFSARELVSTLPGRIIVGFAATVVVGLAAHIAVPLPFTPVPLTMQPLAVLGVGLALGPTAGFVAMLAYLAEGALGLPVFAPTGLGGVAQLLGPTGGFLMAYPLVAAISGGLTRVLTRRLSAFLSALLACSSAVAFLFLCGAAWLMLARGLPTYAVWMVAVAPFLPGEAVKVLAAAGTYSALTRRSRT